jgi:acyl-coenzyme A thioesterase PaaI-like protein
MHGARRPVLGAAGAVWGMWWSAGGGRGGAAPAEPAPAAAEHARPSPDLDLAKATRRFLVEHTSSQRRGWLHADLRGRHKRTTWDHHFIHSSILGPGVLERYDVWVRPEGGDAPEVRTRIRLGRKACGHPTVVHGGAIAAVLDDAFGSAFFVLGQGTGFTANLSVNYRKPVPPETDLVIVSRFVRREGRKVWLEAKLLLDSPADDHPWNEEDGGDAAGEAVLFADATALFVIASVPKTIEEAKARAVAPSRAL